MQRGGGGRCRVEEGEEDEEGEDSSYSKLNLRGR